jgi:hypothetical protein
MATRTASVMVLKMKLLGFVRLQHVVDMNETQDGYD